MKLFGGFDASLSFISSCWAFYTLLRRSSRVSFLSRGTSGDQGQVKQVLGRRSSSVKKYPNSVSIRQP